MAFSRPVVASATGGIVDMIHDRQTGLLVAPGDALALAGALNEILDNPEAAHSMGARASAAVRAFEVRTVVERIEQLYDSLVGPRMARDDERGYQPLPNAER
jgi:glycosyltransferase involved in cell wall biosynthesis